MLPFFTMTLLLAIWIALGARWAAEDVAEGSLDKPGDAATKGPRPRLKHPRWIQVKEWGTAPPRRARYNIHA